MQIGYELARQVRDNLEIVYTSEYINFLKCYFRVFSVVLTQQTKPQASDSLEHKLRNVILEITSRLPHSEVLRPFVHNMLKLAMHVLTTDNEDNGLISIRIIFKLLRNYKNTLERELQPFLDFVKQVYQNFGATVCYYFDSSSGNESEIAASHRTIVHFGPQSSPEAPIPRQLNLSTRSFKIVTECPLIVVFLFQVYDHYVQTNVPILIPLMATVISIPGPQHVSPKLKNHYVELKCAQVKTVSFLTYLLRSFADYIRPHEESISKSIVNLLISCPDSVIIRKELLVATKNVLATDFRRGFFQLIDNLLEERVLVGTGQACFETLRPLAYSILAELIHHVRLDLPLSQLSQVIYLFSRNTIDLSFPLSVQTTCARLMLNLVEPIFSRRVDPISTEEVRASLGLALDAFASKFGMLKHTISQ
ncbi:hypothetical protein KI387_027072, partial [Taxus chinensis]